MAVLLNRTYQGAAAGSVVELPATTEAALIAQGLASAAVVANVTTGAVTSNTMAGTAAIPAGASSVTITNNNIDASTKVYAVVAQAAADATLLRVERIVPALGSVAIYGTANATATTLIDWALVTSPGLTAIN